MKLYLAWDRMRARQSVDAFVRTTLVRGLIDGHRRPWRREHSRATLPDRPAAEVLPVEDRLTVRDALAKVAPGARPEPGGPLRLVTAAAPGGRPCPLAAQTAIAV